MVVLVGAIGKCFGFSVEGELVSNIVMAIAGVLVVFGVVTMPQKKDEENSEEKEDEQKIEDEEKE